MLKWEPLSIPAQATPEQAFGYAANAAGRAQAVFLIWDKSRGWGGCAAVPSGADTAPPALPILLSQVGPWNVEARYRRDRIILPEESNGKE